MRPPDDPLVDRITLRGLADRFLAELHLDRGLGYTIKLLVLRPREAIQEYLYEDRRRMVRPFTLLLLSVGVATFLSLEFLFRDDMMTEAQTELADFPEAVQRALTLVLSVIRDYFNLVFMSALPGMAVASFLVFRSRGLNLAEHLVLNAYLFSVQTIAFILAIPLLALRSQMDWTIGLRIVYTVWFYRSVFDLGWWSGIACSAVIFLVGQALLLIVAGLAFGIVLLVA